MLLQVIEYFDHTNRTLVQRVPAQGSGEIPYGSQLIVQQNQEAVFFMDGKAHDVLGPGRHTLTTQTIPILTRLLTLPWEKNPFTAQVYFVSRHTFLDQRWGTRQPITLRDHDFGMVRLRGFGKYAFRVADATLLVNTLIGTQGKMTTEDVTDHLRDTIVTRLTDLLGTLQVSLLDLPSKLSEVSAAARAQVADDFARYGLELTDLLINSITPPEEVQRAIDARAGMAAVGDLHSYTLYQAGNSMRELAKSGGGGSMGLGMGMVLPNILQQAAAGSQPQSAVPTQGSRAAAQAPAATGGGALDLTQLAAPDPQQMVRNVARSAGWTVDESREPWRIVVPIGSLRQQVVEVHFSRSDDQGYAVLNFRTWCGPASAENALQFLRYNAQLVHGAFAVHDTAQGMMIALEANQLAETADSLEITRAVAAVAFQADQVEHQLLTNDQY